MIFNEDKLQKEIIKTWGEFGAHNEVFKAMTLQIKELKEQLTLTDVVSSCDKQKEQMTPKEFIDENYFSLTLDCKREIEEIYQALEDYSKTKQLTIPVVVSTSNCEHKRGGLILRNNEWFMECRKCGDLY